MADSLVALAQPLDVGIVIVAVTTRLNPEIEPDLAPLSVAFNDMADQLIRRLERDRRFAADVSHELRSPLQTLEAAASVIDKRRDELDDRAATAVSLLTAEVGRFQTLVNELLELARSDRPADREPVDMAEVARHVCRTRGLPADLVEISPDAPETWLVDRRRIEQALGNLVDNAIRYGGGPIAVRVGGGFLEVDDAGPGVAEKDRRTIFDRFVRGPAANDRGAGDGTGLGLAIVAEHASAHGGGAAVTDRPGGGARFRIDLPGKST